MRLQFHAHQSRVLAASFPARGKRVLLARYRAQPEDQRRASPAPSEAFNPETTPCPNPLGPDAHINLSTVEDLAEAVISHHEGEECVVDFEVPGCRPYDVYRDSALRYCGYANEVGEAFAAWLPLWGVPASYAVAIVYVVADTVDKTRKGWSTSLLQLESREPCAPTPEVEHVARVVTALKATDTLTWQMLASVILPGTTIHTIVWATTAALVAATAALGDPVVAESIKDSPLSTPLAVEAFLQLQAWMTDPTIKAVVIKSVPTGVGLACIPLIVHPLDELVHFALDTTYRPWAKKYAVENAGDYRTARLQLEDRLMFDAAGVKGRAGQGRAGVEAAGAAEAAPPGPMI